MRYSEDLIKLLEYHLEEDGRKFGHPSYKVGEHDFRQDRPEGPCIGDVWRFMTKKGKYQQFKIEGRLFTLKEKDDYGHPTSKSASNKNAYYLTDYNRTIRWRHNIASDDSRLKSLRSGRLEYIDVFLNFINPHLPISEIRDNLTLEILWGYNIDLGTSYGSWNTRGIHSLADEIFKRMKYHVEESFF